MSKTKVGIGGCFADDHIMEYAWNNGVRLFDSGWGYQGNLVFETKLGNFIEKHKDKRSEMIIVDKLPLFDKIYIDEFKKPLWDMTDDELLHAITKILSVQLKTLKTDYIDYYLLHAIFDDQHNQCPHFTVDVYRRILKILNGFKENGIIKHTGFSGHITFEKLYYFINETADLGMDVAEVSYNVLNNNGVNAMEKKGWNAYTDVHVWSAPGEKGLQLLKDKGFIILDCMPHESGRLGYLCSAPDWYEWNDRFIFKNKNIDYVLVGTSSEKHLDSSLIKAGMKKDTNPVPDMRVFPNASGKKCCGE